MFLALLSLQAPGIWLLLSLITGLLIMFFKRPRNPSQRQLLQMGLWVLIPYLGLLIGGLSPRLMGISNLDWLPSIGLGLGFIFVVLLLLLLVRAATERESPALKVDVAQASRSISRHSAEEKLDSSSVQHLFYQFLQHGAQEFHWCFLRGALWEFIYRSPTPPSLIAYWAIWIAALLAIPEISFGRPNAAQRLFGIVVLIATSILFFYTRNFWLCWLLHTTAWFIVDPQYDRRVATA